MTVQFALARDRCASGASVLGGVLLIIISLNIFLSSRALYAVSNRVGAGQKLQYTYIDHDYPLEFPINNLNKATMTLQESVHFLINESAHVTTDNWATVNSGPKGYGRVRLGPDQRLFVVTYYHQLHCLLKMQRLLTRSDDPSADQYHFRHCLNYLRQTFLCDATATLEKGDFIERNFELERSSDDLICDDWETVYSDLDANFENWEAWKQEWN